MFTPAPALVLSDEQKAEVEALVRNGHTPQRVVLRCRLLLLAHQGVANHSIAEQVDLSRPTILALRAAFAKDGMAAVTGVRKRQRRGKVLTPELEQKVLDIYFEDSPRRRRHPVERALAGQASGDFPDHRSPSLAASRRTAASSGEVQTLHRSAL